MNPIRTVKERQWSSAPAPIVSCRDRDDDSADLPTAARELPEGPPWSFEVKWDGYRIIAEKTGARVVLRTRNQNDVTAQYPLKASSDRIVNVTKPNQIPSCSSWLHDAKKVHAQALIVPLSCTKNKPKLAAIVFMPSREEVGVMQCEPAPYGLDREIEVAGRHYDFPVLITASDVDVRRRLAREIHDRSSGTDRFVFVMLQNIDDLEIASFQFRHATLFIDDVGVFDQSQQAALMRLLEYRAVVKPTPWRLITASDLRLYDSTIQGRFRADLYYRLSVIHVVIPD